MRYYLQILQLLKGSILSSKAIDAESFFLYYESPISTDSLPLSRKDLKAESFFFFSRSDLVKWVLIYNYVFVALLLLLLLLLSFLGVCYTF